jgi:hypothetical protein
MSYKCSIHSITSANPAYSCTQSRDVILGMHRGVDTPTRQSCFVSAGHKHSAVTVADRVQVKFSVGPSAAAIYLSEPWEVK